jgi:addiction module HigA family antidote
MLPKHRKPTHPGEILLREFLEPLGISQVELAKTLGVPVQRINTLVKGKRGITAATALLLAKKFDTTPEFWMNLQNAWDLYEASKHLKLASA